MAAVVGFSLWNEGSFANLKPNEWGDFLAGCFGPLALFWLILGFWQQGDELRASVEALMMQGEELRNSVEQQRALVEVTRQQAEAQLAALQEERGARHLTLSPRILVRARGGYSTGNQCVRRIRFENLGANCSDLRVEFTGGYEGVLDFSTLQSGHAEEIELTFEGDEPPSQFTMTMSFVWMSGTVTTQQFIIRKGERRDLQIEETQVEGQPYW